MMIKRYGDTKEYRLSKGCYIWQYDSQPEKPVIYIGGGEGGELDFDIDATARVKLDDLVKAVKDMEKNAKKAKVNE